MASTPTKQRPGRPRAQLPSCYYEGYLEKRAQKEKVSQRQWACLCGNALFFYNSTKDSIYAEKLDLNGFISLTNDDSRDRNLEAAKLNLRLKDGEFKLTAPSLEARELWKGFIYSVVELTVPSSLNLLPGQILMLREVVERERQRRKPPSQRPATTVPLHLPLLGEIPSCFQPVSRTEAELLLERHPDCGNLLLRPGRDGSSLAVTTRQDLSGPVFRHYRVTQKQHGGYVIDVENPIPCATLHDVVNCLVDKTSGTLRPFLLEQPYEENITFVKSNDENGERSLQRASSGPFRLVPALPPKAGHLQEHPPNTDSRTDTNESIYLNEPSGYPGASRSPLPFTEHPPSLPPKPGVPGGKPQSPHRNSLSPTPTAKGHYRYQSGADRRAQMPLPPVPVSDILPPSEHPLTADSLAQVISEELKLKLEKRRTNQQ